MALKAPSGGAGRGGRRGRGHRPDGSINVTPFVDVLLILLVVFMVVSAALPGLSRSANVVVVINGTNQGEVYETAPDSLRIESGAVFAGTKNEVTRYLLDTYSSGDNFSYRGIRAVLYVEVEAWARELLLAGYRNVKLRLQRDTVGVGAGAGVSAASVPSSSGS